jgi:hypothetical protein
VIHDKQPPTNRKGQKTWKKVKRHGQENPTIIEYQKHKGFTNL